MIRPRRVRMRPDRRRPRTSSRRRFAPFHDAISARAALMLFPIRRCVPPAGILAHLEPKREAPNAFHRDAPLFPIRKTEQPVELRHPRMSGDPASMPRRAWRQRRVARQIRRIKIHCSEGPRPESKNHVRGPRLKVNVILIVICRKRSQVGPCLNLWIQACIQNENQ